MVPSSTITVIVAVPCWPAGARNGYYYAGGRPARYGDDHSDGGRRDDTGVKSFTLTVNQTAAPAMTYALAEGATGAFFDTDLLLANPNAMAAPVTITWFLEGGGTIVEQPHARADVAHDDPRRTRSPGSKRRRCRRSRHLDGRRADRRRTHDAVGCVAATARTPRRRRRGAAPTWYFAEGAQGFFSTYLLLANPHATAKRRARDVAPREASRSSRATIRWRRRRA